MMRPQSVEEILERKHSNSEECEQSLSDLRCAVAIGLEVPKKCRGRVWKLFLRLRDVSATCYIGLVHRGPSTFDQKIRSDTGRTLKTDMDFVEHVSVDMLIRVLNAFVWISRQDGRANATSEELQLQDQFRKGSVCKELTYVQGMNVILAPFLRVMPEMEAFYAFSTFVWRVCPLYVQPTLRGVHCGARLVDLCLRELDPELYGYLSAKELTAKTYAFKYIMTFSACRPPLSQVLLLWDVMLAVGAHLNVLFIVAQLSLIRSQLMQSP
ncbi:hypothetical protein EC973_006926, partial [Apophysomyces ossiformis]